MASKQTFDGLAQNYDLHRPRYPATLIAAIADAVKPDDAPLVIDAGAGTGIALEALLPRIPGQTRILAVDLSPDMVDIGRKKFPEVEWTLGPAEPFLEAFCDAANLVIAAQAYQWMDRPRFLIAARSALRQGGALAIIQNNRDFSASPFLHAYEGLLEHHSPGYSRDYRAFDIAAEMREVFGNGIELHETTWCQSVAVEDFVVMSSSSSQAQRAIAVEPGFLRSVEHLARHHAIAGCVNIPYRSELFIATRQD